MTRRCSICTLSDERGLTKVSLADGTEVTVCGTHQLMFYRSGILFRTLADMRAYLGDRRRRRDRREGVGGDALAMQLVEAFAAPGNRRASSDRRR
ncbi:MAG: hypothetical protein JNL38_20870 [Myxococcales bacterium]|jgi:hypothetical protein|nr:hypothetical protein [Myxococcales bacterium]